MSQPLQLLIGAACLAVIGAAGYYFWGEYRAARELERISVLCRHHDLMLAMLRGDHADAATVGSPAEHRRALRRCVAKGYESRYFGP